MKPAIIIFVFVSWIALAVVNAQEPTTNLIQRLRRWDKEAFREVVREKRVDMIPVLEELRRQSALGEDAQFTLARLGIKKYRDEIVQELINPTNTAAYAYYRKIGSKDSAEAKLRTMERACNKLAGLRDKSLVKYLIAALDSCDNPVYQRIGVAPFREAGYELWSMKLTDAPTNSPVSINLAYRSAWKGWWEKHKEEYEKGGILPPLPPPPPPPEPPPPPPMTLEQKLRDFDGEAYEEVVANKRVDLIPLLEELARQPHAYRNMSKLALARLGVKKYRDEIVQELINPTKTEKYAEMIGGYYRDNPAKAEWTTIRGACSKVVTIGEKSAVKYLIAMLDYQGDLMKRVNMPMTGNTPQDMAGRALLRMQLKDAPTIHPSDVEQHEFAAAWKQWWKEHKDEYEKLETSPPVPSTVPVVPKISPTNAVPAPQQHRRQP